MGQSKLFERLDPGMLDESRGGRQESARWPTLHSGRIGHLVAPSIPTNSGYRELLS
jgi:hypothetical protein